MRYLLYNIRYGTGRYLKRQPLKNIRGYLSKSISQINKIGEFINIYNPDVVGLVEVDLGTFRSGKINQAAVLGELTSKYNIHENKYGENSKYLKLPLLNKQGNAFLVKSKIENQKFHFFENGMKKLVIELETEDIVFFLVHLALDGKTRMRQISQLYDLISSTKKPFILSGDFNLFWGEEEIKLFIKVLNLKNPNVESIPTFPSWKPKKVLDFILYSENIKVNKFKVIRTRLSDHLPLLIDFEIL